MTFAIPGHRQLATSADELKDLGGWKDGSMVDRYAKFATEHLAVAAAGIALLGEGNVMSVPHIFFHTENKNGLGQKS